MSKLLFEKFIIYAPTVFFWASFLLAGFFYFRGNNNGFKNLVIGVIGFRVFYAIVKSVGQYYIWSADEFTRVFLKTPGYFSTYIFHTFWLNVILSIGISFLFLIFLESLRKHRDRFFESGEIELGFLTALIAGWPNFLVFIPLVFLSVILISIFRRIWFKEAYTTLGKPFLLVTLITLLVGSKLISVFHLRVFEIKI